MAPAAEMSAHLLLPSKLVGRLIGKAGATIQELERLTCCRIRIPRRGDAPAPAQAAEELVPISIRCAAADAEIQERRCARAAELLCTEGLALCTALAQADTERKAQEAFEEAHYHKMQLNMAVQRILLNWREFEEADICFALGEACNDEDEAVDLLLQGCRAPRAAPQDLRSAAPTVEQRQAEKKEKFPSLPCSGMHRIVRPQGIDLGARNTWTRSAASQCTDRLNLAEAFPGLPEPMKPVAKPAAAMCSRRTFRQSQVFRRTRS
mmetsp:Transcript_67385/g.171018  ORF Transcript_67385/g.171018 Transcript_67385/m.171018 type:complete len:265 (+) Transcript_67385:78-872(+)